MSEQEQLPVCEVCKRPPSWYDTEVNTYVYCTSKGCVCVHLPMPEPMWRRLMARPRLAPERVEWLRSIAECSEYGMKAYEELIQEADQGADLRHIKESVDSYRRDVDAIRAALAALGEECDG